MNERKGSPVGCVIMTLLGLLLAAYLVFNPAVFGRELRGLGDEVGPWFSAVQQAGWGR